MSRRALGLSALVCAALVLVGRWAFDLSWESSLVLAPVFVISAGAIAFLVVLWGKVIYESLRSTRSSDAARASRSDSSL